jgi:hypothetical protein
MTNTNKYTRPSQARLYDLNYHLLNTDNLRLRNKADKLVKIIPEKYKCEVIFTKRRIWFIKADRKLIQLIIEKRRVLLKVKTNQGWLKTKLLDWENFRRVYLFLENR